jgi:hypothetical protein
MLIVGAALALGCSGSGEVGDDCDTPASEGECVDGAVCESLSDSEIVCLKICSDQADCDASESCNGISDGSDRKACHPK